MVTKEFLAIESELDNVLDFANSTISTLKLETKKNMEIQLVIEEIFANIAKYAYPNQEGKTTFTIDYTDKELILSFKDKGFAYNPLEKSDPDIFCDPNNRSIGGLGIFLTKKLTDSQEYKRINDENIFTVTIKLS